MCGWCGRVSEGEDTCVVGVSGEKDMCGWCEWRERYVWLV